MAFAGIHVTIFWLLCLALCSLTQAQMTAQEIKVSCDRHTKLGFNSLNLSGPRPGFGNRDS